MKDVSKFVLLASMFLASCVSHKPTSPDEPEIVSLEVAREMILTGEVESVFQPHFGQVIMILNEGHIVSFEQPHLDWVISLIYDNDLINDIQLATE